MAEKPEAVCDGLTVQESAYVGRLGRAQQG
jgi:hypothetical protein